MKQETGNSISVCDNKVSIQLPLGGHSFSPDAITGQLTDDAAGCVECTVLTPRTVLVPRECFDPAAAEHCLRIAGLPCLSFETAVTSDPEAQIVAVMAVDAQCLGVLRERFGERLTFTSPLCREHNCQEPTVWLFRAGDLIYIKVYKPELRMAEVLEISSEADVLQLLADLEPVLGIRSCRILCCGDDCDRLRRRMSKYYPDVRCE